MGYGWRTLAGIWYSTYICLPLTTGLGSPLALAAAGSVARSTPTQKKLHSAISRSGPPVAATASGLAIRPASPTGTAMLAAIKSRRVNSEEWVLEVGFDLTWSAPLERVTDRLQRVKGDSPR